MSPLLPLLPLLPRLPMTDVSTACPQTVVPPSPTRDALIATLNTTIARQNGVVSGVNDAAVNMAAAVSATLQVKNNRFIS